MLSFVKWMLPVVALGLVLSLSNSAKAADAKTVIKGQVVDKDGKAVEGATVNFAKAMARGQGGAGAARPEPIATATTDKDGNFTLTIEKAIEDGNYGIMTRVQGQGMGRQAVVAKDGKLADRQGNAVEKVTLKLGQGGRRGGAGA